MTPFETILARAGARAGGDAALAQRLPKPKTATALKAFSDDRYLSEMCKRVFRAGLKHSLVDNKWPAFEEVFHGFEPKRVRAITDEGLEALMGERRIIRHWGKIKSVRANAAAICELADEQGGVGAYLADWPSSDIVGLWEDMTKRFAQLGGNSGPYFLRMVGKDSFILTPFVVRALNHWGAFDGEPKGKGAKRQVQAAFNDWANQSGRPLCQLSMILAMSVD